LAKDKKPEAPKAEAKKAGKSKKPKEVDEDFKYIVRIANSDLKGERPVEYALTSIKGIGRRAADIIIKTSGVPGDIKVGTLTDEQEDALKKALEEFSDNAPIWALNRRHDWETGEDHHIYGAEVELTRRDDINRMKKIRCYKGVRHETGHKVRGQRTRSNGRTGLTLGVSRKKS